MKIKHLLELSLLFISASSFALSEVKTQLYQQVYNDEFHILSKIQTQCPSAMLTFEEALTKFPGQYPTVKKGSHEWQEVKDIYTYAITENCKFFDADNEAKLAAETVTLTLNEAESEEMLNDMVSDYGRKIYISRVEFALEQNERMIKNSIEVSARVSKQVAAMYAEFYSKEQCDGVFDYIVGYFSNGC